MLGRELKQFMIGCGIRQGTKKQANLDSLQKHLNSLPDIPKRISALDFGYVNLGYCSVDLDSRNIKVRDWKCLHPSTSQNAEICSLIPEAQALVQRIHDPEALYVIESQTTSISAWHGKLHASILKTLLFKSLVVGMLTEKRAKMAFISPITLSNYFKLSQKKEETERKRYRYKKKEAILRVKEMIQQSNVTHSLQPSIQHELHFSQWSQHFLSSQKKDDLADAFLLAVAQIQWLEYAHLLKKTLIINNV
jgi:hypothetical protein